MKTENTLQERITKEIRETPMNSLFVCVSPEYYSEIAVSIGRNDLDFIPAMYAPQIIKYEWSTFAIVFSRDLYATFDEATKQRISKKHFFITPQLEETISFERRKK